MWDLRTLAQFQVSDMSPRVVLGLYGWVYVTFRLSPLAVEHIVVVVTGFPIKRIPD